MCEAHALGRNPVDGRRGEMCLAVAAEIAPTEVVSEYEDNVRAGARGRAIVICAGGGCNDCPGDEDGVGELVGFHGDVCSGRDSELSDGYEDCPGEYKEAAEQRADSELFMKEYRSEYECKDDAEFVHRDDFGDASCLQGLVIA